MNKSDIKLIIILIIFVILLFVIINFTKKEGNKAVVYYEDDIVKIIDLNIDDEYKVEGYLGDIVLEVKDKKIRVKEEISPKNLCSKEGYTNSSFKPLICLPNKVIVKIIEEDNVVDGVVY